MTRKEKHYAAQPVCMSGIQRTGLARELMTEYIRREKANGRSRLYLTCLDDKVKM